MTIPRVTKFSTHEFFHPRIFSRLLTSFAYRASGVTKFKTTKINSEDPRQLFTKICTPENYPLYGIYIYRISSINRPGVFFFGGPFTRRLLETALIRGRRLFSHVQFSNALVLHLMHSVSADGESWQRLLREGERSQGPSRL